MSIGKTDFIWLDGEFVPWDEAKTHVLDHSLHYGGATFEGIRGYKLGDKIAIFRIDEHIDRLFNSASSLKIKIPFSKRELREAIVELVRRNKMNSNFYIRPLVWLGSGTMKIFPSDNLTRTMIAVFELGKIGSDQGMRVKISPFIRPHPSSFPPGVKIVGAYVSSMLALTEAKEGGFDDAFMLDHRGYVAEGTGGNIFLIKDGELLTPSLKASIIPGITRDSIIEMSKDLELVVEETDIKVNQLYEADEVFLTGTALEITPVIEVSGKKVSNGELGKITEKIRKEYTDVVHGKNEKYNKWLTFV